MALASDHRLPTLGDARRAADALREALDPGVVLLFGSVACGRQQAGSDLDFVLVFDDLGDYAQRRELAVRAEEAVAKATGIASDVRVTDRPEWEVRTKRCQSTFEAHIVAHAVTLASRPPSSPINWQKEIGMAPSDEQQSADSLDNTTHALNSLIPLLQPSGHESDALLAGDFEYAEDLERSRMLNVCAYSQVVMETSLKALIHALKGPHPANIHSIGGLIDAAASQLSAHDAVQIEACLGQISPQDASVWRETSTYPADARIKGDPQAATPEFAAHMAEAAAQTARTCISLITRELGYQPAEAQQVLTRCHHIDQELPAPETPTRNRDLDIGL